LKVRLIDLPDMHPALLWDEILVATAAVMDDRVAEPFPIVIEIENVPGHASGPLLLQVSRTGISGDRVRKIRRTYDANRRVELAAIAVIGLAIFEAGGHQIRDVALRGSAADYLVDEENHLLEITGRSRRSDVRGAWEARWQRLAARLGIGFYLGAVEFETPSGRLEFAI
jgi:hypothetical protein